MKALITGVSGFVGTFLCDKLLENDYEVVGLSRTHPNSKQVHYIPCDITDSTKVEQVIKMVRPDEIYHLAGSAFIPASYKNPMETYNTIVNGTIILYESLRKLELDSKILFVGSAEVYGEGIGTPFNEDDLLHPNNPYAGAKACADIISEQYAKTFNMRIIRARPFNHTGPQQSSDYVCSNFAKQIAGMELHNEKIIHAGNVNVVRDFLDVRDVVNAYYLLMKDGISGQVYNVSSNNGISILEMLNLLLSSSNVKDSVIKVDSEKVREKDPVIRVGNNAKLQLHTDWLPEYDLKDTMSDLLDYWRHRVQVCDQ
ncbi:GDP-mannose 4,6-dehydratase [Paenibacillus sp. FSL H8-0034]|uniref:GDP-mannose 4,6-dehydratase n=1 Tax=Paenibacillus sp. FSL H8-0034 TaxID=2954671 RepID=UPI0030F90502